MVYSTNARYSGCAHYSAIRAFSLFSIGIIKNSIGKSTRIMSRLRQRHPQVQVPSEPSMSSALQVPECDRCQRPSVLFQRYSGRSFCNKHLLDSVHKRFAKELRRQLQLPKGGRKTTVLVAISGGKDSALLLNRLVTILGPRKDVELVAGCVDEGIDGYRSPSMDCAKRLAESLEIPFHTVSYPELGFERMDEVVQKLPLIREKHAHTRGMAPCSFCGVFRRQGLNRLAEKVGADVMALGHNLDDMAQTVLMNMQKGDLERSLRLAPHTESPLPGLPPRIVPMRWIPEQEVHACAMALDLPFFHDECPHAPGALRQRNRHMVSMLEDDVPGSRHGLVHMVDAIKGLESQARKVDETRPSPPTPCPQCSEPTSGEICKACEFMAMLKED